MNYITYQDWYNLGLKLYGPVTKDWRFKCVHCGNAQSGRDFKGITEDWETVVFFSCIGRYKKNEGCDWTLGGLFSIHKREIIKGTKHIPTFLFADEPEPQEIKT